MHETDAKKALSVHAASADASKAGSPCASALLVSVRRTHTGGGTNMLLPDRLAIASDLGALDSTLNHVIFRRQS